MILARTELATIDALRASGEEPERILELIESIVNKGIDTGRFDMCHVETDPEAALRLAEALLGTNRYPAFARAMRILEAVTPYVEDRSDGMLLFTLSTIARLLCGRPFDAAGRAVSGIGEDERDVRLLYLLGILRAGEGRFDEAREWLLRADVESPDDPVILHALELVAARESLERILLTRPLWEDGDLDHTAPGTLERALRMACVELDPDGYADALIALNATGLELDDESFLRMEVELSGHAVPFVFEMNHAGLSKMDPAWLARLVESVSDVLEHAKAAPEHLVEVRARLDRSVRLVLIWPEPHEGMWRLLVYIEDFKGTEERARIECFQAVRALIDRTVGEAARLRRADAITLVPKAPSGEGLTLSEFREFLFEKAPECRRMTLKDYAWLPHEYGMRPDTRPGAPLLADVTEGITHCPPLGYLYGQGKSIGMDALGAAGACAGFLFLDVKDDAEGLAPKKDRRIKARKTLEVRLRGLGDGYLDVVGYASGVRYEYLQFIAWDLSAVLECASAAFEELDDVVEAGFHTYLRDASAFMMKTRNGNPEDLPDEAFGEDEAEGSHLFGSMKAGGDEHAAERRGGFRDPRLTAAATA